MSELPAQFHRMAKQRMAQQYTRWVADDVANQIEPYYHLDEALCAEVDFVRLSHDNGRTLNMTTTPATLPTLPTINPATGVVADWVYVLKCIDEDGRAYNSFLYPKEGRVEAPDWNQKSECGGGLHGWVRGEGDYVHAGSVWLVLAVDKHEGFVDLDGKCKFKACTVIHYGTHESAVAFLFSVTTTRNPGVTCLAPKQCVVVARRAADRAQAYADRKAKGVTKNFADEEREAHRRDKLEVLGLPME